MGIGPYLEGRSTCQVIGIEINFFDVDVGIGISILFALLFPGCLYFEPRSFHEATDFILLERLSWLNPLDLHRSESDMVTEQN